MTIAIMGRAIAAVMLVLVAALSTAPPTGAAPRSAAPAGDLILASSAGPTLGPPANGLYLGIYNPRVTQLASRLTGLPRYRGARMRIIHRFQAWWGRDRLMAKDWMNAVARRRAVPMITWEPWRVPAAAVRAPNHTPGLLRRIASGRYDVFVRRWARDARAYGKPILMRFMHEMDGTWYPWSVGINANTAQDYKAAWRRVWSIFRRAGATNVGWVFSVTAFARDTTPRAYDTYYPGSRYVDWIGVTALNWGLRHYGGFLSFDELVSHRYNVVRPFNKPIMLAEIGVTSSHPEAAGWVRDALRSAPGRYPGIKAMVWFDSTHPERDFRLRVPALRELRSAGRASTLRPSVRFLTRRP